MSRPRLIVTRPQPEADHWVAQLQAQGVAALALPLIEIGPATLAADIEALAQAQAAIAQQRYGAIMLVSGNAAQYFLGSKLTLTRDQSAPAAIKTRVWSPGPGTARAAMACGIPAALIDQPASGAAQLDSESLWEQVAPQAPRMAAAGQRVLIVRGAADGEPQPGGSGRNWLAAQLQAAGVGVDFVAVYERRAPCWTPAQRAIAEAALHDGSVWLLSSSQAVMHLRNSIGTMHIAGAPAIATHPRIAHAAVQAGFSPVKQCRPALGDVIASLESGL